MVLEKTLESPLDYKEIKLVNPMGNQPWIFIGRTDAKAEASIPWPPDGKSWPIRKDPDAGKDWRQEKWMTEDEMTGWHHQLNGHEFEQAPGDGKGREAWRAVCPEVSNSQTWLGNWTTAQRKIREEGYSSLKANWEMVLRCNTLILKDRKGCCFKLINLGIIV